MSRKIQLLLGCSITAVSLLASLLILEIAVRIFFPANVGQTKGKNPFQHFPDRPLQYFIPTDSPTLRGNADELTKPADTTRIAIVGDSFTFGPKMQFFDAFPFKLQTLFNLNKDAKKIEVRSYGTPGAGTKEEISLVENAIKAQSDLIILEITLNDPQLEPYRKTPPDFDPQRTTSRIKKILFHSALYRFIATRIFNYQSYQRYIDYTEGLFHDKATRENFENSFRAIAALAKKNNTPLVVMTLPLFDFDFKAYPVKNIHEEIGILAKSESIPYLDTLPAFNDTDNVRLEVVPGKDNHPNEIAHRIIAESLYKFLIKQKLISAEYSGLIYSYREAVFQREKAKRFKIKKVAP